MTTLLQKMQSTYYIAFKGMYDDVVAGECDCALATYIHTYIRTYIRMYKILCSSSYCCTYVDAVTSQ